MSTKDIRTTQAHAICDVCGRTLLRGERAEVFIEGRTRRSVCELCKARALHEGWVREGTVPSYTGSDGATDRSRSLFGRFRKGKGNGSRARSAPASLDDELSAGEWGDFAPAPPPLPVRAPRDGARDRVREPRHVRAVPTNDEHKIASALDSFNRTEHTRTVAGVARSLGAPGVSLTPDPVHTSLVRIVVSWELCWYRYEVDLSDEPANVRLDGQGYELAELTEPERVPNALTDDLGRLHFA